METQFGYHIINVTETKSNRKYSIGILAQDIIASEQTRKEAFEKATKFLSDVKEKNFYEAVDQDSSLLRIQALEVKTNSGYINNLTDYGVRQVVQWAYDEKRTQGDVSSIIDMEDMQIVVFLRKIQKEGMPKLEQVRQKVVEDFKKEWRAKYIASQLSQAKEKNLESMARGFSDSKVDEVTDMDMSNNFIEGIGLSPVTVGTLQSAKVNQISAPIQDETGVVVVELSALNKPLEVAGYSLYKTENNRQYNQNLYQKILKALEDLMDTKKEIYRYF